MTMWFGLPNVAVKYPNRSVEQDIFAFGASYVTAIGSRTLGFYLSDGYSGRDYIDQDWSGGGTTYLQLVQKTFIADVLASGNFDRFVIWCFAIGQADMQWRSDPGMSPSDFADEYSQMYDLAKHLAETYPGKEFILKNWEGDWQIRGAGGVHTEEKVPPMRFEQYKAYHATRQRAVHNAMRDHTGSGNVRYAIEGNRILDNYGALVVPDLIKVIQPDIVAASIYEATETNYGQGSDAVADAMEVKLREVVKRVKRVFPNIPIMIGEFSWPQDYSGFYYAHPSLALLVQRVYDVAVDLGIIGIMWWQIFDNEEQSAGVPMGFGAYSRNGSSNLPGPLTGAGQKIYYLLNGGQPTNPSVAESVTIDGTNDYINVGKPPGGVGAPNSREITISFWFKVNNLTTEHYMFGVGQMDVPLIQYLMAVYTDGHVFCYVGNLSGLGSSPGLVVANTWYHMALVVIDVSGTKTVRLYLDGTQVTTDATAGSQVVDHEWLFGGIRYFNNEDEGNTSFQFAGKMCQFSIFDKGLTTTEVVELKNIGVGSLDTHSQAAHLKHWWYKAVAATRLLIDHASDYWGALVNGAGTDVDVP